MTLTEVFELVMYWINDLTTYEKIIFIIKSKVFQVISSYIIFILFIVMGVRIYIKNLKIKEKRREEEQRRSAELLEEEKKIKELIEQDIDGYDSDGLKNFIEKINHTFLVGSLYKLYSKERDYKLIKATDLLEVRLHNEELYRYQTRKDKLKEEICELRQERWEEEEQSKRKKELVLERLNIEENSLYVKDDLREAEIEVLKENDFDETTEYDPIENQNITFFVKKVLNHSATHTFLVERIKQLLERSLPKEKIRVHETRDADLTFQINHKVYALEIETGSGLTKKKKLNEKVSLLNNKYGQNWYIVVSNRNLAKKYREYGKVTSRKGVCKLIEKLLEK